MAMGVADVMAPSSTGTDETRTAVVLMVDDDPQLRVMLGFALRQEGFQVEEASAGEDALEMLKHQEPDIILLDVLMPGIGGVETCRRIREKSSVPIIMLTALGRDEDIVAGLGAGADSVCTKPGSFSQLVARIGALFRPRELDLLERLARRPGQVVSHRELLEHVWGSTSPEYLGHLRSYIKLLRQKIEPDPQHPRYIRSRPRLGYVLEDRPREVAPGPDG